VWDYVKNAVYDRREGTRNEILEGIFDAARSINDTGLLKLTFSIIESVRMCIQPDGSNSEYLLN